MRKRHSRLPIILILITLLSVADWAVAGASSRVRAITPSVSRIGSGTISPLSGEPDAPGIRDGGGKAIGGSSSQEISGDARVTAGIWIRLLQVRLFGQ